MRMCHLARNGSRNASLLAVAATFLLALSPLAAQFKAVVRAKLPDTPEGIGIDSHGTIYANLLHRGELVALKKDGDYDHVAWIPSKEQSGKGTLVGLEIDKDDNIFVAYKGPSPYDAEDLVNPLHPACKDATVTTSGVYKVDAKTRAVTPIATRAQGWPFCFPDDIALDKSGNIYLTDLTYAGIWKISPDGKKVEPWSTGPLLNWTSRPYTGTPIGVNDLVIDKANENIYAVTDAEPMLLKIPIKPDGSAGEPQVLAVGFSVLDGLELDDRGNIYISEITLSQLWALSPDGSRRVLIASKRNAPLDNNTSLVIRDGMLCTSNLGAGHATPQEADRTVVCMTGWLLP